MSDEYVKKTVNITREQAEWLKRRFIQFSVFVRNMITEAMKVEKHFTDWKDVYKDFEQSEQEYQDKIQKNKKGDVGE